MLYKTRIRKGWFGFNLLLKSHQQLYYRPPSIFKCRTCTKSIYSKNKSFKISLKVADGDSAVDSVFESFQWTATERNTFQREYSWIGRREYFVVCGWLPFCCCSMFRWPFSSQPDDRNESISYTNRCITNAFHSLPKFSHQKSETWEMKSFIFRFK